MSSKEKRTRSRKKSPSSDLRNQTIVSQVMAGATQKEVASQLGMSREQVGRVMNSEETRELIKLGQEQIKGLMMLSITTLKETMENRNEFGYANAARQTAEGILKSIGVLQTNVNLNHSFPKPTVIEKLAGGQIVMGSVNDGDDEE